MPSILAPILPSSEHRSCTCGSRAALKISVRPSASTAARRMFSVPVTVGRSNTIRAPPSRVMISPISRVSVTRGTFGRTTWSEVSSAAAISGRAAFFEPLTQISPASWAPPVIFRIWSEAEPLAAACPRQPKARLCYREGLVELDLLRRREGAGQPLLRALASGLGLLERDLVRVLGHVGEHCDPVGQDLEEAATDEEQLFLPAVSDLQRAGLEDRHQRGMPRQHPELAVGAVGDDE